MEYMDTAPAFLLPLNFFKLPFMVGLGNMTPDSLMWDFKLPAAMLALALVAGAALFF